MVEEGASGLETGGVVPLVTTLALLHLDVVDLDHGVVIIILLPLQDITQGLSLPGKNDMLEGGHTRAHPPTMAPGVAV